MKNRHTQRVKTSLKGGGAKLLFKNLITTDFVGIKIRDIFNLDMDINQKPEIKFGKSELFQQLQIRRQKST